MNSLDSSADQNSNSSSAPGDENNGASTIHESVDKVRQATASTAAKAKDKVAEIAGQGKNAAVDKVAGYSDRLRNAAKSAEESQDPNIAHFAGQAADRLEQVANYVRDADFNQLREDASQVARRHPALFMGGMLVAGLVLGNLAKASFQSLGESDSDDEADDQESDGGNQPGPQRSDNFAVSSTGDDDDDVAAAAAEVSEANAQL